MVRNGESLVPSRPHTQFRNIEMREGWRSYFPQGSLNQRPDLHRSVAEWYAEALDRLRELPFHPVHPEQPLTLRLLCLPTWFPACSVRAELNGLAWRLYSRELDGQEAGFDLGQLARSEERLIVGEPADRLTELWKWLNFWSIAPDSDEETLDGTEYVLEVMERGRYRVVVREDPEWGDPFGDFADFLMELAGLAQR
jgi:hypothetical protein